MAYSVPWDESVPAGTDPAANIDVYIQDDKIAVAERLSDILGIVDFTLDPLIPTTLKLNRTTTATILGGTTSIAIRNAADNANNLLIIDAGTATFRSHLLSLTDNSVDLGASGASRFRTGYFGTSIVAPSFVGTISTAAQPNITSLGTQAAHLLFVDNTYDIGASGATRPRNVYIAGALVAGSASFLGTAFTGNVTFVPDNTYDIGASGSNRPRTLYAATSVIVPTVTATTVGATIGNITTVNSTTINATTLVGTLSTAAQSNVTSLGTLAAHLLFVDNTYDIGASGATRPRTLYLSNSIISPAGTITTLTSTTGNITTVNSTTVNATTGTFTNIGGTLTTAAQENVTSLGTLTGLVTSGQIRSSYFNSEIVSDATTGDPYFVFRRAGSTSAYFYSPVANQIDIATAGIGSIWRYNSSGHFLAATDNSYDIGASGATRPRNLYVATNATIGSTITLGTTSSRGTLNVVGTSGAAPIIQFSDNQSGARTYLLGNIGGGGELDLWDDSGGTYVWRGSSVNFSLYRHLIFPTDNTYDIGASGATRPRTIYVGSDILYAGKIYAPDGTGANPAYRFNNAAAGLYYPGSDGLGLGAGGAGRWLVNSSGHFLAVADNSYDIGASGATRPRTIYVGTTVKVGVNLIIDGVNTNVGLAITGGGTPNLYVGNEASWLGSGSSTEGAIAAYTAGIKFYTAGSSSLRWHMNTSGHLLAGTDNTNDIGASAANRPKDIYAAGNIYSASSREMKNIISDFDPKDALNIVRNTKLYNYTYKANDLIKKVGFIAEEVDELLAGPDKLNMDHSNAISILFAAVKELDRKLEYASS